MQTKTISISEGYHTLTWRYSKFTDRKGLTRYWATEIEYIKIKGAGEPARTECTPC